MMAYAIGGFLIGACVMAYISAGSYNKGREDEHERMLVVAEYKAKLSKQESEAFNDRS